MRHEHRLSESSYELELEKAISLIKESHAKKVGIQLPDGLKQYAKEISDTISKSSGATVFIWAGTHFGACDMATSMETIGCELLIAWGHTEWETSKLC